MAKSNLVKLAKGGKGNKSKPVPKPVEKKAEEKPLTPEEERDLKAKQKVKELLSDVELTPKSASNEVFVLEETKQEPEGVEWLTEEVTKLTTENAHLKEDYAKLLEENKRLKAGKPAIVADESTPADDNLAKGKLVQLFNELQANYLKNPGVSSFGTPNFIIYPVAFMERMIMFFPFLGKEKKYKA